MANIAAGVPPRCCIVFGKTVYHLGGTPAAMFPLPLIQQFIWADSTTTTKDSQLQKFETFSLHEGRGMPPGEFDLLCGLFVLGRKGSCRKHAGKFILCFGVTLSGGVGVGADLRNLVGTQFHLCEFLL